MTTTLYHGSEFIIEKPQYHGGKKHNDYGFGFYTTEDADLAREWAVEKDRDGYVNRYSINMEGMKVLNLSDEKYTILHWLEILLENRTFLIQSPLAAEARNYLKKNFHVEYESADIMIGYRADDSYFSYALDFLNGTISLGQLSRAMKYGNLGEQIVIKSPWATQALEFAGYEKAESALWYPGKQKRDQSARKMYFDIDRNHYQKGDLYMIRILDEEVKSDDPRLR